MKKSPWTYFLIGISCLVVPLLGIAWWIYVAETNPGGQMDMVDQFLSPFPVFLQSAKLITWIELGFCAGASWAFFKGLDHGRTLKWVSFLALCFTGLIGFWLLFSLM
jgi:hypothetical protein